MALTYESDVIKNRHLYPPTSPRSAREVHCQKFEVEITAALQANDLIGLAPLPGDCIPVDIVYHSDDLDSGGTPALVMDVGVLNTARDDLVADSNLVTGSTVGQSAGFQRMNDYKGALEAATWLAKSDCPHLEDEKVVAAKVTTAPATGATGKIRGILFYRASEFKQ